ncbi:unnamed protein product [Orchesella dallaii]|uniref:Uncharacterized protein n=1 Tax=Orchesella dallaii TaxID=48710 RepID=A0ABP1RU21_9HEXA
MLKCRLVHSRWKASMDKVLERKCLEMWTKWEPYHQYPQLENTFPNLQLAATTKELMLDWVLCPSKIFEKTETEETNQEGTCSIPSKSLCVNYHPNRELNESHKLMRAVDLFSKCGHSLTCITFHGISIYPRVLNWVLNSMPNLKGMTISNLFVRTEWTTAPQFHPVGQLPLPSLPRLEHLRLFSVESDHFLFGERDTAYKWFMRSYAHQLVSLETDECFSYLKTTGGSTVFPKLKQFKVYKSKANFYSLYVPGTSFPVMERVSFVHLYEGLWWEELVSFVGLFSKTITHLHLDFQRNHFRPLQCALAEYERKPTRMEEGLQFSKLKTLGIFYPKVKGELEVIKKLLRMTPKLERLQFFQYQRGYDHFVALPEDFKKVRLHLERESYAELCPTLKKISVYFDWDERSKFYSMNF